MVERIYAVLDNPNVHSAPDVPQFALAASALGVRLGPKYATYLDLIEPWWKLLRSLALKGRRFDAWVGIERAIERTTAYWNKHDGLRLGVDGVVSASAAARA